MFKLYLAGPMSGLPQFNFPAFADAKERLEAEGYDVCSPHLRDDPAVQDAAWLSPDGNLDDLPLGLIGSDLYSTAVSNTLDISECDGLALLPGWSKSSGARHEVEIANRFRQPVAPLELWLMIPAQRMVGVR